RSHHSVFPTVTRVNSSSYSTGCYPAHTGLMGNTVYFPEVDKVKGLNTGEASDLNKITEATHGQLLQVVTLGELLQKAGRRMMVFSSGSTGQALLQNHTVSGGAIVNPDMILPESFKESVVKDIGPIPAGGKGNGDRHAWVASALLHYGLRADGPAVSAIWFSDPDGAAHANGIGSGKAMESIKVVDAQFGRILDSLRSRKLDQAFNIIISTDHGFVTHTGKQGVTEYLIEQGLKQSRESEDVVVAEGAIYVKDHNADVIKKIVTALQSQPWIGGIFTKGAYPGDMKGSVPGTLSFEAIHWDNPTRAGDILVDMNWNSNKNDKGYEGSSFARGVAGHGGMSPYEVHIALLAAGPSFKKAYNDTLPSSNVDIAPTILRILHLEIPATMDGRPLDELLLEQKNVPAGVKKEVTTTEAKYPGGIYELSLQRTVMGKYQYVDF
ncbi:MAG: alkaline phosphatase family protein, partial [Bacteroidetes bacterium]|nr:alkaline phosphatase family protein [Bacteroidota bacterium]